jgi:predicted flap endonuclease-1-like 5' DNA nuclease
MGSLLDIAEIAALLFVAYIVGWLAGYWLHRLAARTPRPEVIPAERMAAAKREPSAEDALVRAPVVVPVSAAAPPPHVVATATQIEPVRAVAVPGNAMPAEAKPMATIEPPPSPQISAIETLKALSTAIPLVPVEATAEETIVEPVVVAPEPPEAMEAEDTPEPIPAEADPLAEETEPAGDAEPAVAGLAEAEPEPEPEFQFELAEIVADPESPAEAVGAQLEPPPATIDNVLEPAPPVEEAAPEAVALVPEPEPVAPPPPPKPASAPGVPWAGALKGHEARKFEPPAKPVASTRKPATVAAATVTHAAPPPAAREPIAPIVIAEETATPIAGLAAETLAGLDVALLATIAAELKVKRTPPAEAPSEIIQPIPALHRASEAAPAPIEPGTAPQATAAPAAPAAIPQADTAPAPSATEPVPPPAQPAPVPVSFDEGAAMRAIEGGWSRRAARALPDTPEMTDVSAAVSAAQVAVEQVLARNGVSTTEPETRAQAAFGKPVGLPQPRDGRRDNLKRIDGLGPLDESTLNNLGIYHYDQIAKWDEREVLWLENHVFAVGRIGRESWQDQARELIADREATRALR